MEYSNISFVLLSLSRVVILVVIISTVEDTIINTELYNLLLMAIAIKTISIRMIKQKKELDSLFMALVK